MRASILIDSKLLRNNCYYVAIITTTRVEKNIKEYLKKLVRNGMKKDISKHLGRVRKNNKMNTAVFRVRVGGSFILLLLS